VVTLEVNNSREVARPGVQPANMILLWGLQGLWGSGRLPRPTTEEAERERERERERESERGRVGESGITRGVPGT